MKKIIILLFIVNFGIFSCKTTKEEKIPKNLFPTESVDNYLMLDTLDVEKTINYSFSKTFGKYVKGYNSFVLQAIDSIQKKFPDGGGYFTGIKAVPAESPIGYNLKLFGRELLNASRTTSYCSGASYTAFIESLNLIFAQRNIILNDETYELMRMQEADGGRREDGVKFWGNWNADGYGSFDALVSYSGMGIKINPNQAVSGDFMNISWKSGIGHSVVFLGWLKIKNVPYLAYWSSQKRTNGLGLDTVRVEKIKNVSVVRLTNPEKIMTFTPNENGTHTEGDVVNF